MSLSTVEIIQQKFNKQWIDVIVMKIILINYVPWATEILQKILFLYF